MYPSWGVRCSSSLFHGHCIVSPLGVTVAYIWRWIHLWQCCLSVTSCPTFLLPALRSWSGPYDIVVRFVGLKLACQNHLEKWPDWHYYVWCPAAWTTHPTLLAISSPHQNDGLNLVMASLTQAVMPSGGCDITRESHPDHCPVTWQTGTKLPIMWPPMCFGGPVTFDETWVPFAHFNEGSATQSSVPCDTSQRKRLPTIINIVPAVSQAILGIIRKWNPFLEEPVHIKRHLNIFKNYYWNNFRWNHNYHST